MEEIHRFFNMLMIAFTIIGAIGALIYAFLNRKNIPPTQRPNMVWFIGGAIGVIATVAWIYFS